MIGQAEHATPETVAEALATLPDDGPPPFPSPGSWADEVIYFLLPDRFSDDQDRPALDDIAAARPAGWSWTDWADSGANRYQGGTLKGARSRLPYLKDLGVTAIWLGPPWAQRAEQDTYHGYAIQNFLDVDSRFGSRRDLVDLVAAAHDLGIRVILDVVVNHSGENWAYASELAQPPVTATYRDYPWYDFGAWVGGTGQPMPVGAVPTGPYDGVWPRELQEPDAYHRAGLGDYSGDVGCSAWSQPRRADWHNRDFALSDGPLGPAVLQTLIDCWTYWLRLTGCDGFRIDTFKHFRVDEGRRFCAALKETAAELGKDNFLLAAEVGGGDDLEERYLNLGGRNLSAALEIGQLRQRLRGVAAGLEDPAGWFDPVKPSPITPPSESSECPPPTVGTHRDMADAFVYTIDDHDNVWLDPVRFAADHPAQVVPAVALLLFCLGIPCLYYGTEQGFCGPPESFVRDGLPSHRGRFPNEAADRYLREAMFGPDHPRRAGLDGMPGAAVSLDPALPGFGPFGTSGHHCFRTDNAVYRRVRELLRVRREQPALRRGRQYLRDIRTGNEVFHQPSAGGLIAWSRLIAGAEAVCVVNAGPDLAGADVTVDATLNHESSSIMQVLADTSAVPLSAARASRVGEKVPVQTTADGRRFVHVDAVAPYEVLVLGNRP